MKKYVTASILSVLGFAASAGEAIIPYWALTASETLCMSVSNISNNEVQVNVRLYNQDGSLYSGALEFASNISSLNQDTLLPARSSADFCLKKVSGDRFGHGIIETAEVAADNGKSFVVAHGRQVYVSGGFHSAAVPINNGLPF